MSHLQPPECFFKGASDSSTITQTQDLHFLAHTHKTTLPKEAWVVPMSLQQLQAQSRDLKYR